MSAHPPLISIIVASKNPGPSLRVALESVWAQQPGSAELIIVDGASTDGSLEWLGSQREKIHVLLSAPDDSVYDAMNKGVQASSGEWLLFLGSDDQLANHSVLQDVRDHLLNTEAHIATGAITYADGRVYRMSTSPRPLLRNFIHHQATFYRRTLFKEHGLFDAGLKIMADYDFNLRLWRTKQRFESLPQQICTCGYGGLSDAGRWLGYREEITVRHRHFSAWQCWPCDLLSLMRYFRKKMLRSLARKRPE